VTNLNQDLTNNYSHLSLHFLNFVLDFWLLAQTYISVNKIKSEKVGLSPFGW